jgi:hypothetical protein
MMTFRGIDENEAQEAVDRLLADVMDDYLAEPEKPSVRVIAVQSNGRLRTIKVTGNVIWFPISGKRKAK